MSLALYLGSARSDAIQRAQPRIRGSCGRPETPQISGGPLRAQYERIAKRRGSQIAKVAIGRPDPHALLLRPLGRRDPLPRQTPRRRHRQRTGARRMTRGQPPPNLRSTTRCEVQVRASSLLCLVSSTNVNRTTAGLVLSPPGTARHPGPPNATEWMTAASSHTGNARPRPGEAPHPTTP